MSGFSKLPADTHPFLYTY